MYKLPVPGASGVAFGGLRRDILFVTVQSSIIDSLSLQFIQKIVDGTSVYMIMGLNVTGMPYSRRLDITNRRCDETHKVMNEHGCHA